MNYAKQRFTRARKEFKVERANKDIRKGDIVQVIAGRSFSKTGKVLQILTASNRCIVEKVNMVKKHRKPTQNQPGGIDEKEGSIHLSNVKLVSRGTSEVKASGSKKTAAKTETKSEKTTAKKKVAKK